MRRDYEYEAVTVGRGSFQRFDANSCKLGFEAGTKLISREEQAMGAD